MVFKTFCLKISSLQTQPFHFISCCWDCKWNVNGKVLFKNRHKLSR